MGERPYRSGAVVRLAEAVYAQGRLEEAQQLTEEAKALAAADDVDTRVQSGQLRRSCSRDGASSVRPGG